MASLHIYHNNAVLTATLTGGSWDAVLGLEMLREAQPRKRAISNDLLLTSTQFRVELSDQITTAGVQIISTNLSIAALYKITWYTDSSFTTVVDTSGWQAVGTSIDWTNTGEWPDWLSSNFWLGAAPFNDPDNQGLDIRHTFATPTNLKFIKFEFDDTSNSDGEIAIGHLYIGNTFVPSSNIAPDPTFTRISRTGMVETQAGSAYFSRRGSQKRLVVGWPLLPKEEVLGDIDSIVQIHDIDKPVYVDLDPDNMTTGIKTAFLARMNQLPEARLVQAFLSNDIGAAIGFEFIQVV